MSNLVLSTYATGDLDYVAKMNADARAVEAAVNELRSLIQNTFGDGALLIDDLYERDGIVGAESFYLDTENYAGGNTITVGRRPVPAYGETNESVAYMTAGGARTRVAVPEDQAVSAAGVISGLPKTIYLVLTSGGSVQFEEDPDLPNLLYLYKMCWNGFSLYEFARMAPILPAYSTFKKLAAPMIPIQIFDPETNFMDVDESETSLMIHGVGTENAPLLVAAGMEVLGGFVAFHKEGPDGAYAPFGSGDDVKLELEVVGEEGETWNAEAIEIQMDDIPATVFWKVKTTGTFELLRFVNELKEFRLNKVSIGQYVVSARAFTWGLYVRPIVGAAVAHDTESFDGI